MKMTFRWYGDNDPVTLGQIRQIPGVTGIVSAIYNIPVGKVWPVEAIRELKEKVSRSGLALEAVSYTHLDVYKRQVSWLCEAICRGCQCPEIEGKCCQRGGCAD